MNTLLAKIVSGETNIPHPVEVPEWGVTLHVKALTAGEMNTAFRAGPDADFHLVKVAVVDDKGQHIFPTLDDVKARSHSAIRFLVNAIMAHNKLGPDANEDAKKA